jgi:hypothetical protein
LHHPASPDLAPQLERSLELDPDLSPGLRAPVRAQHHAQDAVDAEPRVPEAGVGVVHFVFLALVQDSHRAGNLMS